MNESASSTLQEYWYIAVKRKWWILGVILLSLAVAGTLCKVLPKSYRSNTLILVEAQKIPENYVEGIIVERSIEERIWLIKRQVTSRTRLAKIIAELKLYQEEVKQNGLEAVIGKIRDAIEVVVVGTEGARGVMPTEAFTISFSHENPFTAMKVTSRIASQFIEENLKNREQFMAGTSEFLDYELARAKADLEKQEDEITRFKSKHMGELPGQMEANLSALDRLQNDLTTVAESFHRLSDQLATIEKGIALYEVTGNTMSGLAASQVEPDPLVRRLKELEQTLSSLSAEYKDSYPDIILTRREIEKVKAELGEIYVPEAATSGEQPFDPYLQQLNKQRDELRSEIVLLKRRQHQLTLRKKDYEKRVEKAPALEQSLLILLRDYENIKDNYRSLLDKRLNARVAENLEKRQKGQQFRIIDPANVPGKPYKPNQMRIMIFGLAFGCALGFGMAYILEQFNPTFHRPEDIELLFGLDVLAAIPDFTFVYDRSMRKQVRGALEASQPTTMQMVSGQAKSGANPETLRRRLKRVTGGNRDSLPLQMSLVAKWLPTSIVAEQYRIAATQLSLMQGDRTTTVVEVTSAVKGEGKTTTVVNLGYTLARDLGKRTLLIDCDLKCPMLHRYANTPSEPGLVDLLNKRIPLEECLSSFGEIPCWIMSAGGVENQGNEIFKTRELASILTDLRGQFEYILINVPPILPLADMNVLAGLADVLVLVVRAGSTPQQVVQRALNRLRIKTQAHIILNAVEPQTLPYYMNYSYYGKPAETQRV